MSRDVHVDVSGLRKMLLMVNTNTPQIKVVYHRWAERYRSFAALRFDKFSKGGGDWAPLKPATIRARRQGRKRKGTRTAAILADTATVKNALTRIFVGNPGQFEQDLNKGIRVGYGGGAIHPASKGAVTVSDIADWHQTGAGRLPQRKIIVDPDQSTINRMAKDIVDVLVIEGTV